MIRTIISKDGIRGLWRGNAVNLSRVVPAYAMRFTVFGQLSGYKNSDSIFRYISGPFASGCVAGLASSLASYPLEVLRTRLSVGESLIHAFRRGSLYSGCSITVLETIPYSALTLGTYRLLSTDWGLDRVSSGLLSGLVATSICFPLDTVRRTKIVNPSLPARQVVERLLSEGGWRRLYRGLTIALVKSAPTVTVTMVVNDFLLDQLVCV